MALQAASSEAILANHQLQITAMKSVALAAAPAPAPAQQAIAQATMPPMIYHEAVEHGDSQVCSTSLPTEREAAPTQQTRRGQWY
jgi:hypothetical protein